MSGFALFSLKDPSLLALEERQRTDANLKRIFGLEQVPSDTQMRTILDEVDPENLRPLFGDVFRQLQRGKVLKQLEFLGGYLLSLDGTGYFTSKQVHCASCLEKRNKKTGEITYSHQMLGRGDRASGAPGSHCIDAGADYQTRRGDKERL